MPRPIFASIDLSALRHNLAVARSHAGARRVWAVVKANAYGHGIERAVRGFAAADGLALLDLEEARRARAAGWSQPILLLEGFFEPTDLPQLQALALTAVVHHRDQVDQLAAWRPPSGTEPLAVVVKLDTGMRRLGFAPGEITTVLQRLGALPQVRVDALMTHFANADGAAGPGAVDAACAAFAQASRGWSGGTSLANSAALFMRPQVAGTAVRPGIVLYGGSPGGATVAALGLRAAMHLRSQLIAVREVAAGEAVGYGGRWRAPRPTRVGVVACGYADGYPRLAPDGTPVLVDGIRVPLAGQVSMDMITVDLTGAPGSGPGAEVELWGARLPIDAVAQAAGTVGYELMCALAPRVRVDELA
jgi:alanine racemase